MRKTFAKLMKRNQKKITGIVDGEYTYQYKLNEIELVQGRGRSRSENAKEDVESERVYAVD